MASDRAGRAATQRVVVTNETAPHIPRCPGPEPGPSPKPDEAEKDPCARPGMQGVVTAREYGRSRARIPLGYSPGTRPNAHHTYRAVPALRRDLPRNRTKLRKTPARGRGCRVWWRHMDTDDRSCPHIPPVDSPDKRSAEPGSTRFQSLYRVFAVSASNGQIRNKQNSGPDPAIHAGHLKKIRPGFVATERHGCHGRAMA
ncbi:hypothetical protein CLV41_1103 [Roseibium marinum]|uniref:Uncharacterized protein n=1 Tax=Roseibium marinum TaxID=281252 RepID=A0A2S3UNC2_9HYPH|nr:hypothetical protein CLV41_1103 [Roseibium marinum]